MFKTTRLPFHRGWIGITDWNYKVKEGDVFCYLPINPGSVREAHAIPFIQGRGAGFRILSWGGKTVKELSAKMDAYRGKKRCKAWCVWTPVSSYVPPGDDDVPFLAAIPPKPKSINRIPMNKYHSTPLPLP